jgi:molecular chaperone DnaK (HSP70)
VKYSVYAHTKRWICQCFINYLSKFDNLLLLLSRVPKTLKIRYLKEHLQKKLQEAVKGMIQDEDLYFVLTVPAIWHDPAKQFMREAAEKVLYSNIRFMLIQRSGFVNVL